MSNPIDHSQFPNEMSDYFDLRWSDDIWQMGEGLFEAKVSDFEWHLDCPFWASNPPIAIFDLKPRTVISAPESHPGHMARINSVDLDYPLSVATFGNLLVVLDGIHRLAKHVMVGDGFLHYELVTRDKLRTIDARL